MKKQKKESSYQLKIICRPRQMGKTNEAVQYAKDHNLAIGVLHKNEAGRISREYDFPITKILTFEEIQNQLPVYPEILTTNGIIIDNAERLLQRVLGLLPLKGFTISDN